MELPQIRLESQSAKLGLQIQKPVQELEQPKADIQMRQPKADLNIETTKGRLTIDQTQAWEDMNILSPARFSEEFANAGKQGWLEGIARRSQEGDQMMQIEHGGKAIENISYQNHGPRTYDFNIGWIPSHFSVKINYEPADVKVKIEPRKPEIEITPQKPRISYTPGDVSYQMEQYTNLKIDFVNLKHVGPGFETSI